MRFDQDKQSKIPYIFLAFFGIVIVVNLAYIYVAKKTWRGVVTENSYKKGLDYNEVLKAEEEQKKLGWKLSAKYRSNGVSASGVARGEVIVRILDKKFTPITDANITVYFRRPAQEGSDFMQIIGYDNGSYKSKVEFPVKGQWDAEFVIDRRGDRYKVVKRFVAE